MPDYAIQAIVHSTHTKTGSEWHTQLPTFHFLNTTHEDAAYNAHRVLEGFQDCVPNILRRYEFTIEEV